MKSNPLPTMHRPSARFSTGAFTLVELLVVVAIIAVLAALIFPAVGSLVTRGRMTKEVHAARQMMMAYQSYAAANDGELLPGYDKTATGVRLRDGTTISGEPCVRYPWRLAAYLNEQVEEILLVNDARKVIAGKVSTSTDYRYRISLNPSLGINAYCLGGYNTAGSNDFTSDVVRRLSVPSKPGSLIVFASARMRVGTDDIAGNFLVQPPRTAIGDWSPAKFDAKAEPGFYGNVDLRWDGKAVCAFLDGSVRLLGEEELRDSRHWSNAAAENDDASYSVSR